MHVSLVCAPRGAQAPELVEICRRQQKSLGRRNEVGHPAGFGNDSGRRTQIHNFAC